MRIYYFVLTLFLCLSVKAQEIKIEIDSATGGKLIIDAEKQIMDLIDEKNFCKEISTTNASKGSKSNTKTKPTNKCQGQTSILGFMIKVGDAKSEQDINSLMAKFKAEFPNLRLEKDFFRPDFRLRAGDYLTKESAQADLKKIKRNFPTALIVNWRIYCSRAK